MSKIRKRERLKFLIMMDNIRDFLGKIPQRSKWSLQRR